MNFDKIAKTEKTILIFIGILFLIFTSFIISMFYKDNKKEAIKNKQVVLNDSKDNVISTSKDTNKFKLYVKEKEKNNENIENINPIFIIYNKPKIYLSKNLENYINSLNGVIDDKTDLKIFNDVYALDYNHNKLNVKLNIYGIDQNGNKVNINKENILNIPSGIVKIIFEYEATDNFNNNDLKSFEFKVKNGLESINIDNAYLNTEFNELIYDYDLYVDSNASNLNLDFKSYEEVKAIFNDEQIDIIDNNLNLELQENNNHLTLITNGKNINFNIIRKEYEFNSLKTLSINNNEIDLNTNNLNYEINNIDTKNINIKATAYNENTIIEGTESFTMDKDNITKEITVTNNNISKKYIIKINLLKPTLSSLKINNFNLNPVFNKDTLNYNVSVDNNIEDINIEATTNDGIIDGNGPKKLNIGNNIFEIKVQKNDIQNIYNINVFRKNNNFFKRPLESGKVSQAFHNGIDISSYKTAIYNNPVYATYEGTVANIIYKSSCGGNIIYIHHQLNGENYTTEYAHLKDILVKIGDKVTSDTKIATVGGNPNIQTWDKCSTGSHLHYAISKGLYNTPSDIFKKNTEVMKNELLSNIENKKGYSFSTRI